MNTINSSLQNTSLAREAAEDYNRFRASFDKGICSLCSISLESFDIANPCIHWLLRPKGIDKKQIKTLVEHPDFSYGQTQAWLRLLANTGEFLRDINDLIEHGGQNKIVENTIKYKNIEWSFSSSNSCFFDEESEDSRWGPHWHLQIKIDDRLFIPFGEFHLQFRKWERELILLQLNPESSLKPTFGFGIGAQAIRDELNSELIFDILEIQGDPTDASVHVAYDITVEPGYEAFFEVSKLLKKESVEKNIPLYKLLKDFPGIKVKYTVDPHEGIIKLSKREKKGRR